VDDDLIADTLISAVLKVKGLTVPTVGGAHGHIRQNNPFSVTVSCSFVTGLCQ
jgi:hypothetical protein